MPEPELTLNQQLACDFRRNLYVCAGAGSGKTEVLTRRIIHILEQRQLELSQILVVTFTDKAAGQMRARVYQIIQHQIAQNDEHPAYWLNLKENFYQNHISTFHSFCASILREYALEAQIDPDFSILSELEQRDLLGDVVNQEINRLALNRNSVDLDRLSRVWQRGVIVANLIRLIESRSQSQEWLDGFSDLSLEQYMSRLRDYRRRAISEQISNLGHSSAFWEHLDTVYSLSQCPGSKTPTETERLAGIISIYPQLKKLKKIALISAEEGLEVLAKLYAQLNLRGIKNQQLKQALGGLRELLKNSGVFDYDISPAIEHQGYRLLCALANLGQQCLHAYRKQKQNSAQLDFEDLQLSTLELLKSKKHPHILSELRQRFRYIMVDEFQDTNPLQWQILKALASDRQGLKGDKLFMVGDEKQSIYAFRGADVTVFARAQAQLRRANINRNTHQLPFRLPEKYATGYSLLADTRKTRLLHGEIPLEHNFRSACGLVDFLNPFFERLFMREHYRLYDARAKSQIAKRESSGVHVELMLVEKGSQNPQDQEPIDDYLKEAHLIAKKIKHIQTAKPVEYKGVLEKIDRGEPAIAILLGRRNKLKIYEDALRREGIDFLVSKGRGFYQRQEIIDVVNVLEFINQPQSDIPLVGVLRSPLIGLSDNGLLSLVSFKGNSLWDKLCLLFKSGIPADLPAGFLKEDIRLLPQAYRLLYSWIGLKNRLPLSELVNRVLDDCQIYIYLARGQRGAQNLANIEKFIELARNFETSGRGGIWEWVDFLKDRLAGEEEGEAEVESTQGGVVQLMTIHQAKGLEFPMVFVPDLSAPFRGTGKYNLLVDNLNDGNDTRFELGIKAPDPQDRLKPHPTLIRKIIAKQQQQKDLAEKRRLLYVAATRAQDHLVLVGQLSHKRPPHTKCLMDWIKDILDVDLSQKPRVVSIINRQAKQIDIPLTLFDPNEEISPYQEPPIIRPQEIDRQVEQLAPSAELDDIIRQLEPPSIIERPVFSPTSLLEYRRCPRYYYYQHHLGVPKWGGQGGQEGQAPFSIAKENLFSNLATLRGTMVHSLMEDGIFEDSFIEARVNNLSPEELSTEQRQELKQGVKHHISQILSSQAYQRWSKLPQSYQELKFKLEVGNFYLQGIIDQLHFDPKLGEWVVVDYKTNELENEAEIDREIKREGYDFQLQCYCFVASQLLDRPVSTAYLLFSHFPRLKGLNSPSAAPENLYEEIEDLGHKIMRHEFNPLPQDKEQCKNCSYHQADWCKPT